jgi:ribosome maturation factor RimP
LREYKKNVGRKLQVRNNQNKILKGLLVYVDESKILLMGADKKKEVVEFNHIKEARSII